MHDVENCGCSVCSAIAEFDNAIAETESPICQICKKPIPRRKTESKSHWLKRKTCDVVCKKELHRRNMIGVKNRAGKITGSDDRHERRVVQEQNQRRINAAGFKQCGYCGLTNDKTEQVRHRGLVWDMCGICRTGIERARL